jgi:predicted RNase H-like nuclease
MIYDIENVPTRPLLGKPTSNVFSSVSRVAVFKLLFFTMITIKRKTPIFDIDIQQ